MTSTKKKNEDFLKELNKDRIQKGCEYAVLVSLLEPDSDFYNSGIVDVSHRFPKMYVVRPQCFLPIITILRNAAMKSIEYKSELALIKTQNIDITNFEDSLESSRVHLVRIIVLLQDGSNLPFKRLINLLNTYRRQKTRCLEQIEIYGLRMTRPRKLLSKN